MKTIYFVVSIGIFNLFSKINVDVQKNFTNSVNRSWIVFYVFSKNSGNSVLIGASFIPLLFY